MYKKVFTGKLLMCLNHLKTQNVTELGNVRYAYQCSEVCDFEDIKIKVKGNEKVWIDGELVCEIIDTISKNQEIFCPKLVDGFLFKSSGMPMAYFENEYTLGFKKGFTAVVDIDKLKEKLEYGLWRN